MKSPPQMPRVLAASLALTLIGCAEGAGAPTAPAASAGTAAPGGESLRAASAFAGEGERLAGAVRNAEQRARLSLAIDRLSRAMSAGDAVAARHALDAAREGLRYVESDADRDALRLALDAAAESIGTDGAR